jgi:hypothetical protein
MEVVKGADTTYTGCTDLPYEVAADWLSSS